MIPKNATGCRYCGSDAQTGWSDTTYLDGIDINCEDEREEEYSDIYTEEFGVKKHAVRMSWQTITGLFLIIAFVFAVLWGILRVS